MVAILALGAAFLAVATFLGWALAREPDGRETAGVGKPAADFTLQGFDGAEISLGDYRGKPAFIYFWASWCLPCRAETPYIDRAFREWGPKGIGFLGINVLDTESDARGFLQEFRPGYPNARDAASRTYIEYGVYGVPEAFFINSEGIVVERWVGALSEDQLRESLARLAAE